MSHQSNHLDADDDAIYIEYFFSIYTDESPSFIEKIFIFNPDDRMQVWRFLSYMFLHTGFFHILLNIFNQLLLGVAMEYVNPWWHVLVVYFSGGLYATLLTSIVFPHYNLLGASGGVYGLLFAILFRPFAILAMRRMTKQALLKYLGTVCLLFFLIELPAILTLSIVSHVAHVFGGIGGAFAGLMILKNNTLLLKDEAFERKLKLFAAFAFFTLLIIGILYHLCFLEYFIMEGESDEVVVTRMKSNLKFYQKNSNDSSDII